MCTVVKNADHRAQENAIYLVWGLLMCTVVNQNDHRAHFLVRMLVFSVPDR